jgi:hypothetical protein
MTAILHVVLVAWNDGIAKATLDKLRNTARGMLHAVPGIMAVEEGPNVSTEGLGNGFDYGLIVTFPNSAARDAYLSHPGHEILADQIRANANRVVVFDLAMRTDGSRSAKS